MTETLDRFKEIRKQAQEDEKLIRLQEAEKRKQMEGQVLLLAEKAVAEFQKLLGESIKRSPYAEVFVVSQAMPSLPKDTKTMFFARLETSLEALLGYANIQSIEEAPNLDGFYRTSLDITVKIPLDYPEGS